MYPGIVPILACSLTGGKSLPSPTEQNDQYKRQETLYSAVGTIIQMPELCSTLSSLEW